MHTPATSSDKSNDSRATVAALHEGTFSVGLDKRFIRLSDNEPAQKASLKISINPFLIRHEKRNILLDVGLGAFGEESHIPVLLDNLHKEGLTPDDITDIFLSHLHFDHIGGLAHRDNGYWELTFPEAQIWLSGQEWEKLKSLGQKDFVKEQFVDFLDVHARMQHVYDGETPFEGVHVRVIGGHTEFSLAWFITFGGLKLLNAGDVIGTRGHLTRRFAAKYDFDGRLSQDRRDELIELCRAAGYTILAYHDNHEPIIRELPE